MGFWLGTFIFVLLEVVGFAFIHFTGKGANNLLKQTLWATTIVCCWMMWAIILLAQMHPLVRPILTA